jgi:DNA polymerase (family 10)
MDAAPPDRLDALARDGILTIPDLELAILDGRPSVADPILRQAAAALANERGTSLGHAWEVLDALIEELIDCVPQLDALEASGDTRRYEPLPRQLVAVGRAHDPSAAATDVAALPIFTDILYRSGRRLIVDYDGLEIDVRFASSDEVGTLLFTTTGPPAHVAHVHRRRGPRFAATEADVYGQAGMAYLPPEVRGTPGADDLRTFPSLVTREDIRGDLHMHSTYSDGRDSLREMIETCCAIGYEYVAITDHSEHSDAPHTLTPKTIEQQRDEIARLREAFPRIAILHGIEADILEDGRIDCPDAIMETLDIVLASLHKGAGHDGRRLTSRCLKAIRHPLVSVITHPQNQIVGRRTGYDLDFSAIYDAAVETGTALEIDGAPAHLDLDGQHARDAITRGVTVVVDSDCHRAAWLPRQMQLGLGTARRGWVEPRHVLNTRSLAEVKAFIARKRGASTSV